MDVLVKDIEYWDMKYKQCPIITSLVYYCYLELF